MSNPGFPFYATLGLVAGPGMFWRSFRDMRMRRLIQNTPASRIRSMAMGLVEVNGHVAPRSVVTAPFSGKPCAYWEVDVATRARRNAWSVVHRNASGHPFYLSDDTGTALVYPQGSRCTIQYQVEEECSGLALPDCYADYFRDQHLGMSTLWRMGALRFRERLLEEGQQVYVLGSATPRAHAVAISDGDEMAATGTDDAHLHRVQAPAIEPSAVIRRGENETTFIISQQSERDLTAQLGLRATGELIGGPALTLLGLGYWLYVLHTGRIE
jgi:E3 Ubiquitin ligase